MSKEPKTGLDWINDAEANRREKCGQFSTAPVRNIVSTGTLPPVIDYGECLAVLTRALAHLNEGLPNGQTGRSTAALGAALWAAGELQRWMFCSGVVWFDDLAEMYDIGRPNGVTLSLDPVGMNITQEELLAAQRILPSRRKPWHHALTKHFGGRRAEA